MKKYINLIFLSLLCLSLTAQTYQVEGYVFCEGKSQHDSIKVLFERIAPGTMLDSTYTDTTGYYSKMLQPGIYNICFVKPYYKVDTLLAEDVYANKTLDSVEINYYHLTGSLNGTIGPGIFRVGGGIRVEKNDTLVIKPGTKLLFMPGYKFEVEGALHAEGSLNDSIIFDAFFPDTKWSGLEIMEGNYNWAADHLRIDYCRIANSQYYGIKIMASDFYSGRGPCARPSLDNLVIYNCNIGLYAENCYFDIENIVNTNNESYGFYLEESDTKLKNLVCSYNYSGFYLSRYSNDLLVRNGLISHNRRYGIEDDIYAHIRLVNSEIRDNKGFGVKLFFSSSLEVINSEIRNNKGSGIFSSATSGSRNQVSIINSTVVNNYDTYSGGIYIHGYTDLYVSNSIISNHKYGVYIDDSYKSTVSVSIKNSALGGNSLAPINYNSDPWLFTNITTNSNGDSCDAYYNVLSDPDFVDMANGDCRLRATSPCIDIGINDSVMVFTDLDGNVRIWDGDSNGIATVDMGCYEFDARILCDLGPDTSICQGDSIVLDAGPDYVSYNWNNGSSFSRTLVVKSAGTYYVSVGNNKGNTGTDTIRIFVNLKPMPGSIGQDTSFCAGAHKTFYAPPGFVNYEWSDQSSGYMKHVYNTGFYFVKVTDSNGCSNNSDTVLVQVHKLPDISLGTDTAICDGSDFKIVPDSGYIAYEWNNGLANGSYLSARKSGNYFVEVTDTNYCSAFSDTIYVQVRALPKVKLGADTAFCKGEIKILDAGPEYVAYHWSNGVQNTDHLMVDGSGSYFVYVTDSNGCSEYSDTVGITVYKLPQVDLGNDTSFCAGGSFTLDAGSGYANYVWSNGGANNRYLLIDKSDDYFVEITDQHQCHNFSDTVHVEVFDLPIVRLENDTALCDGDVLILDAGPGFSLYSWNNGVSSKQQFDVSTAGSYSVYVTDQHNCAGYSDTVNITYNPLPQVDLGPDQSIKDNEFLTLHAGPGFQSYTWQNNATDSTFTIDGSIEGVGQHIYFVTVTDHNHCQVTDSIEITITAYTGIIAYSEPVNFRLYPNPSKGHINIDFLDKSSEQFVQILSSSGKVLLEQAIKGMLSLDLSGYSKGLYFLKISGDAGPQMTKLILY